MIGPKEKSGLDMPDYGIINDALKVSWIKILNNRCETSSWSRIPLSYLKPVRGLFLLQCNFDLKVLKLDLPLSPDNKEQILNEIVWNNRFIKIEGCSIYYKQWHQAGVIRIKDIFQDNTFLPFHEFCSRFEIKANFLITMAYATQSLDSGLIF